MRRLTGAYARVTSDLAGVEIRLAVETDLPQLSALVERAYSHYVNRIGRRPTPMDDDYIKRVSMGRVHVAVVGEQVVGLIVLEPCDGYLLVENVAVDPVRQRGGVGRTLMRFAETVAETLGLAELWLYTNEAMTENLAFYPRLGYEKVGRRNQDGFMRVFFSKRVRPSTRQAEGVRAKETGSGAHTPCR